jgi:beta-lactamase superfamily II metal-dependent hydrolase
MRLEFLNAHHGDCFLVRWGEAHAMLVDGGPGPTYDESLKAYLLAMRPDPSKQAVLEIVCITHIDDDHIVGVQRLLTDLDRARLDIQPAGIKVDRVWFNSVEELVESRAAGLYHEVEALGTGSMPQAVAAGVAQGRDVRNRVEALGLTGNQPFQGALLRGAKCDVAGLRVRVVAPDDAALDKLTRKWRKAKARADPGVIAAAYIDRKVPNLSSTVLLLEHNQRTALLTGDARGDHIVKGLEALGLLDESHPMHVNLLKLPHHGSRNNVEREFFERIHADHYVISADGVRHHHPSEETLSWLVESRTSYEVYAVHMTNQIGFAQSKLNRLSRGRAFTIKVRGQRDPALVVDLDG